MGKDAVTESIFASDVLPSAEYVETILIYHIFILPQFCICLRNIVIASWTRYKQTFRTHPTQHCILIPHYVE